MFLNKEDFDINLPNNISICGRFDFMNFKYILRADQIGSKKSIQQEVVFYKRDYDKKELTKTKENFIKDAVKFFNKKDK